jgi:hypothetical protein
LGALSDEPAKVVTVAGKSVQIHQAARNRLLREQGRFQDVTLYYSVQPELRRDAQGHADVRVNKSLTRPGVSLLQFTLEPGKVDRVALVAAVRGIDPYARAENIQPIPIFGLEVRLLDALPVTFPQESSMVFDTPFAVDVALDDTMAQNAREALRNGATVRVAYRTLVKLSQLTDTSIKWSEVKKTRTFRDYNGPSGPSEITAAQVVDAAMSILSELKVFHWEEVDSGGASGKDYGRYLEQLVSRFLVSRNGKMVDFEKWTDTQRFDVPLAEFQKKVDEIRSVAIDSKNLNNDEWCRKYSDQLKTLSESSSARNSPASLGLKIGIPKVLEFGLDAKESTVSSSSKNTYEKLSTSEDCGKKVVERNYAFKFEGVRYVPKSIKVYERNKAAGDISDAEQYTVYRMTQKMGRNEWSISSR